ncbi:MAG: putative LPS assembly protein LptD [Acidobacteriota bacterium]
MSTRLMAAGCALGLMLLLVPAAGAEPAAQGQTPPSAQATPSQQTDQQGTLSLPFIDTSKQWRYEQLGENHFKLTGDVELESGGTMFFADEVEIFRDQYKMIARGNVVMATATQRIGAEWMEFDYRTKVGTFYNATGSARMAELPTRTVLGSQEPDILFYGKTIEKIGDRKYRVTGGAFTTCVQPSPRWQITSGSVVLNLDHYAFLTNSILRVKGVPVLYMPAIYYPINKEDRATGLLMPIYGSSSLRGHTFSNAFFWAIGRSQDATFMHDWYSKTGMGFGSEYRYVATGGSGNVSFYRLNEHESVYAHSDGTETIVPGRQSFQVRSSVTQALPGRLKAYGRVDYFSSLVAQQQYTTNVYQASQVSRAYGGGVTGTYGPYTIAGGLDRSEYFYSAQTSVVSGAWPRLSFNRAEKPIGRLPLYSSVSVEWANLIRQSVYRRDDKPTTIIDTGVQKFDVLPALRFPFTRIQWLPVTATLAWRYTWWNESIQGGKQVDAPVTRTFFDMTVRASGPIVNRVWNTNNGFAEKIKHTIEPWVFFQKFTSFDTFNQIVAYDPSDYLVPGVTRVTYGVNNRLFARRLDEKGAAQTHQFVNVTVRQTYYTDQRASSVDPNYASSYYTATRSNFSPISLVASFSPRQGFDGTFRAEYNTKTYQWQTLGAAATYNLREVFSTTGGWSRRTYGIYQPGSSNSNHYMDASVLARTAGGRVGGAFSFNFDIQNRSFLQKRFTGYYNAQCCGIAAEFQTYNFSGYQYVGGYRPPVDQDVRFSVSVTLAGLGTFANFLGVFGVGQGFR